MTQGYIDSASIYQVVQCFDTSYAQQFPWALQTAIEITSLLVCTDHQHMAPGIGGPSAVLCVDEYDRLVDELFGQGLLRRLPESVPGVRAEALKKTKRWVGRTENLEKLSLNVDALCADRRNYEPWMEWSVKNAWPSHSSRLNGLFDTIFTAPISRVLGLEEREVLSLHCLSADAQSLQSIIAQRHGARNNDFRLLAKAYIASAVLRGKFHDEVARLTNLQVVHHPIRTGIGNLRASASVEFPVSNTMRSLAMILIHGAAGQKTLARRLTCWVDNIQRVRPLLNSTREDVGPRETSSAAVDVAVRIANKAAVHMGDKRFTKLVEVGLSLGAGILTHMIFNPWGGVTAAAFAERILHASHAGDRLWNAWHLRGQKLKDLGAGRVSGGWGAP